MGSTVKFDPRDGFRNANRSVRRSSVSKPSRCMGNLALTNANTTSGTTIPFVHLPKAKAKNKKGDNDG